MSDFRVQYISGTLSSAQTQKVLTAPADFLAVNTQRAFILPATSMPTIGVGADNNSSQLRDWLMHAVLDATQITIDRGNDGTAANYAFYIIEYIGASGGPNELIMRARRTVLLNTGTTEQDSTTITGITTLAQCVPFVTALYSNAGTANLKNFMLASRVYDNGVADVVRFERTSSDQTVIYTAYCVEFTGSNWRVQSGEVSITASNADIEVSISALPGVSKAWLHSYYRAETASGQPSSGTAYGRIHSTTSLRVRALTSILQPIYRWFVIANIDPLFSVQHIHAVDGTNDWLAGASPQTQSLTTNVTAEAGVFVAGQAGSDDGSSTANNPAGLWRFRRLTSTSVEALRLKSIGGTEYVVQVVQLPADEPTSVTTTPAPGQLAFSNSLVNGPVFANPGVALLTITGLGQQSVVFRTPDTATLTLVGYQASVIAVNPAQAPLSLEGRAPTLATLKIITNALPDLDYSELPSLAPIIIFGGITAPEVGFLQMQALPHSATEGGNIAIRAPGVGAVSMGGLIPLFTLGEVALGAVTAAGLAPELVGTAVTVFPEPGMISFANAAAALPVALNIPFQWIDVDPAPVASWM